MTNSQLLDHAVALRSEGKFQEAYDIFLAVANNTGAVLEKAGILLNAVTNLTQLHNFQSACTQLASVRWRVRGGEAAARGRGSLVRRRARARLGIPIEACGQGCGHCVAEAA